MTSVEAFNQLKQNVAGLLRDFEESLYVSRAAESGASLERGGGRRGGQARLHQQHGDDPLRQRRRRGQESPQEQLWERDVARRHKSPPKQRVHGKWASGDEAWLAQWLGGGPGSWDDDHVDVEVYLDADELTSGEEVDPEQRSTPNRKERKRLEWLKKRAERQQQQGQQQGHEQGQGQGQQEQATTSKSASTTAQKSYAKAAAGGDNEMKEPHVSGGGGGLGVGGDVGGGSGKGVSVESHARSVQCHVNLCETADQICMMADLPGFSKTDVKLNLIDDQSLVIHATKQAEKHEGVKTIKREIRMADEMHRTVKLPCPIDPASLHAHLEHGLLKVSAHKIKPEKAKHEEVPISVE